MKKDSKSSKSLTKTVTKSIISQPNLMRGKMKKSHVLKLTLNANPRIKRTITKKEKQKLKAQKLKAGIEKTKESFREEKARMKREKRPIIGDLKPLLDSLPSLDELLSIRDSKRAGITSTDRQQKLPKNRRHKKELLNHEKTEKMLDRFDHVNKIWRDPEFQKNPRNLIAERIRQRRLQMANEIEN